MVDTTIGIDISKDTLEQRADSVNHLDRSKILFLRVILSEKSATFRHYAVDAHRWPTGATKRFDNTAAGHKALIKWIGAKPDLIVFEPTGPYHRALEMALATASSSRLKTVECGSFDPVAKLVTDVRFFHLATVFGLIPYRFESALRLS